MKENETNNINSVESSEKEPNLNEVKLGVVMENIKKVLNEDNAALVPVIRYTERGIIPEIEVRLLSEPVRNVYDEQSESTEGTESTETAA